RLLGRSSALQPRAAGSPAGFPGRLERGAAGLRGRSGPGAPLRSRAHRPDARAVRCADRAPERHPSVPDRAGHPGLPRPARRAAEFAPDGALPVHRPVPGRPGAHQRGAERLERPVHPATGADLPAGPARMTRADEPLLALERVSFDYQGQRVLEDFELRVEEGETLAILGPSGCGKTTVLNLLAGFLTPTSGVARCAGQPITGPGPDP